MFKSITADNGSEFLDYKALEKSVFSRAKRTHIYYAHPYSSWERGTNENTNRMIRRFIPKGSDISKFTCAEIQRIEDWINNIGYALYSTDHTMWFFASYNFLSSDGLVRTDISRKR